MPTGLYKTTDQSVQVEGAKAFQIPIPRSTYEKNGDKPELDKLPLEDEYRATQERCGQTRGPKGVKCHAGLSSWG